MLQDLCIYHKCVFYARGQAHAFLCITMLDIDGALDTILCIIVHMKNTTLCSSFSSSST